MPSPRMLWMLGCLTGFLMSVGFADAQAPLFTIQDLGSLPGSPACNGTALSQSGNVVGYCAVGPGINLLLNPSPTRAFLYSKGMMTDLNVTTVRSPIPTGVNDSGTVVGGSIDLDLSAGTGAATPFVYSNHQFQGIPGPLQNALPAAVNNAGQMIATSVQVNANTNNFFIASGGIFDTLADNTLKKLTVTTSGGTSAAFGLSPNGTVAGASVSGNASNITPVLWQNLVPQNLPLLAGYAKATATAVNDSGVAAGFAFNIDFSTLIDPNASGHASLFSNGSVSDLGALPNDVSSFALGINGSGTVVGFSGSGRPDLTMHLAAFVYPPSNVYHAFIYSGGKMYDLTKQLVNGTGWQLSFATQINDAGQIVGSGIFTSNGNTVQRAFLLTPVSGPSITNVVGAGFSTPAVTSISPNGVFTIFGNDLASGTVALQQTDIVNGELPTNLGGTCVESGTSKWGLFFVSPGQVNVLAGSLPASGSVPVSVVANCGTANEIAGPALSVPVAAVAPEFLYFVENSNGQNPVAAIEPNGAYVGPPGLISGGTFAPARAGDVITAFGVGWGPTTSSDLIGKVALAAAQLTNDYSLTLGGVPVHVAYAGVSPGFAGLYQINFTVPEGISAGNQPLVLTVKGIETSATAYLAVGK